MVSVYPESNLAGEADFYLGEADFEDKAYAQAEEKYTKALVSKELKVLERVLDKLAWAQFKQDKAKESIASFRRLIREAKESLGKL